MYWTKREVETETEPSFDLNKSEAYVNVVIALSLNCCYMPSIDDGNRSRLEEAVFRFSSYMHQTFL